MRIKTQGAFALATEPLSLVQDWVLKYIDYFFYLCSEPYLMKDCGLYRLLLLVTLTLVVKSTAPTEDRVHLVLECFLRKYWLQNKHISTKFVAKVPKITPILSFLQRI